MRLLESKEKDAIFRTIETLLQGKEVVAICAYGSQVAGYSTSDSDYDVILVLKPFKQRVKYYYLNGDVQCAALVVDPRSFENDCKKSSLGEFVSGRLLNPHEVLQGELYLQETEVEYKKRVILEGLSEAYAEYLEFSCEIDFPLRYFLFEKLRKRATIYPPVVYSYAQTYSEKLIEDSLESSLSEFRTAARALAKEGVIIYDETNDIVKVPSQKFRGGFSARISVAASYTSKSLKQYAVHGYAGRVWPNVVGKEVISKIARSKRFSKLPEVISKSRKSWSIPFGKLYASSDDWLSDIVTALELDPSTCKVSQNSLGEFYNTASFYTLSDANKSASIAVKRFKDIKGMKWGVLNVWSLRNARFTANAMERLSREYRAFQELREFGLRTPDTIAVLLSQKMMVTNFIPGNDLSKIESAFLEGKSDDLGPIQTFGRDLGVMHNNGYCMGDTKPSNAVIAEADSKIYFTDMEQAIPDGNKVWDVAEFIYYSVRFTLKEDRVRKMVNAFVQGYLETAEDKSVMERVFELRYRAPFQAFIAPNVWSALKHDLLS